MKNNLAKFRKEAEITQKELAEKMQVSRQTIIAIEAGKFNPSVILAIKISRFFKRSIEEIFLHEEDTGNEI